MKKRELKEIIMECINEINRGLPTDDSSIIQIGKKDPYAKTRKKGPNNKPDPLGDEYNKHKDEMYPKRKTDEAMITKRSTPTVTTKNGKKTRTTWTPKKEQSKARKVKPQQSFTHEDDIGEKTRVVNGKRVTARRKNFY